MPSIKFRPDGTFTIAQLTDMHLQTLEEKDLATLELCDRVVETEKPDMIVLSGDIVHAQKTRTPDPIGVWRALIGRLDAYELPWVFLYGNHDAETTPYEDIAAVVQTSKNGLYQPGPEEVNGWSNYAVEIQRSDSRATGAVIFCHDSGRDGDGDLSTWGYVHEDQVEWLREAAATRLADDTVTGLLFVHNPLPQYQRAWQTVPALGVCYEGICFQGKETGTFDVVRDAGISGVFCGHDHVNDFDAVLDGVHLVFGRCTGFNCYGREGFPRGSRIIKLREGVRGFESHIRLEDGSVAKQPTHQPTGDPAPQS